MIYDELLPLFHFAEYEDCENIAYQKPVIFNDEVIAFNGRRLMVAPKNRFKGVYAGNLPNLPNYQYILNEYRGRLFSSPVAIRYNSIKQAVESAKTLERNESVLVDFPDVLVKLGENYFLPAHFDALLKVAEYCLADTVFLRCNSLGYPAVFAVDDVKVMMWPVGEDLARDCLPLTLNVGSGE